MDRTRLPALIAVLAFAASACSSTADAGSTAGPGAAPPSSVGATTTTVPLPEPSASARRCDPAAVATVPGEITYDCYWVTVPERRVGFDGDTLRLPVTVLHSPNPDASPVPLVFISGGPGGPGGSPDVWSRSPYLADRDVIVYDQRGTGAAEPNMDCPEVEDAFVRMYRTTDPFVSEAAAMDEAMDACHDRLEEEGVDLSVFDTPESAADLADLRVALGYDRWHLLGISYGNRVAREVLRSHPEGVSGVVFDSAPGPAGLTATALSMAAARGFEQLAAGCAADTDCAPAHPDLLADLDAVVARYDAEPYRTTVDLGGEHGPTDLALTGADVYAFLWSTLYYETSYPGFPAAIAGLAAGDTTLLDVYANAVIPRLHMFAEGTLHAVLCADRSPIFEADPDHDADVLSNPGPLASAMINVGVQGCQAWQDGAVDTSILDPVSSDLPVLVLSGTYDPITPTPVARQVAEDLGNATFVAFDGMGHGVSTSPGSCASEIALAYLRHPDTAVDTTCSADVGPVDFPAG